MAETLGVTAHYSKQKWRGYSTSLLPGSIEVGLMNKKLLYSQTVILLGWH